jgi:hypothetical protein
MSRRLEALITGFFIISTSNSALQRWQISDITNTSSQGRKDTTGPPRIFGRLVKGKGLPVSGILQRSLAATMGLNLNALSTGSAQPTRSVMELTPFV